MTSIHIRAIDWALARGYVLSVRDYSEDYSEETCDVWRSDNRKEIIEATEATEMPNVHILEPVGNKYRRIAIFSVIDEGIPEETINDYIAKPGGEFDAWWNSEV